ncbi:MAG: sigma-70 family RNA polymerase sigma factor [Candidatus Omnitrophota bacterium]|jgi:RNA polymerase sigma factor (sigma-70 family)
MRFEELVKKISPKLKAIAHKLNGRFAYLGEEDLCQEALAHLWLDFQQGKLDDKTESYILQGCYFHLKNYLRKAGDKASLFSFEFMLNEEGEALDLQNILPLESAEPDYHSRFLIEQIRNDGLTKREKEVFEFSLEGLTTREIGLRLGISHVRVVKLKKKVKEKCKKYLDDPALI